MSPPPPTKRMSADDRRDAIIMISLPLFAKKGYNGLTTKEIAKAADVSEALLYRYFPSKRSLYESIQATCIENNRATVNALQKMPDSAATLVLCVYVLMRKIIQGPSADPSHGENMRRLMLQSLLSKGDFVRGFLASSASPWVEKMEKCVKAARKAGDFEKTPVDPRLGVWLGHHIAVAMGMFALPEKPVVEYPVRDEALLNQAVYFTLAGMGLKHSVIADHLNIPAFELIFDQTTSGPASDA